MTELTSGADGAVDEVKIQTIEQAPPQEIDPEAAQPPATEATEEAADPSQETEAEQSSRRSRRGGFQKKIERLAAENAALRAALVNNTGSQPEPKVESVSASQGKPTPENFVTYEDYVEALTDWKVEERLQKRDSATKQETLRESYDRQIAEAQKAYPDFDEAIAEYDFHLMPRHAQEALLHSEMGAHIAYHIANNPNIGDELSRMTPVQAAMRIGELGLQLKSQSSKGKAAVKVTKAPPPITPLKGAAPSQRTLQDYVDAGDHEGYAAARRAGLAR